MTLNLPVRSLRLALAAVGVMVLSGCSLLPAPTPDPTRYYVLTGVGADANRAKKAEHARVIGLKRIDLAPYLNGKSLVVREAGNEITYAGFSRWAEPLATSLARALAGYLDASEKVDRVYSQPFPIETARDNDLAISITRCEGERQADGRTVASLVAVVELTEAEPGGAVVLRKTFVAPETAWDGKDFGLLATALSDEVAALGADIINALPTP